MRRITKWIQDRKAYSNPVFGLMLMINVMVLPTFQAAAGMDEPVQSVVLNAQDVQDALDAIEAGVSPDKALLEQSKPYRKWIQSQKTVYEDLFQAAYTLADSDYFLFDSISILDERTTVQGQNVHGEIFDLELTLLTGLENTHEDIPDDIAGFLASVNAEDYAFTGTISTDRASIHIVGAVFQADLPDGTRNSFLLISSVVDSSLIDFLNDPARDAPSFLMTDPVPQSCEQAFAMAANNYNADWVTATAEYKGCRASSTRALRNGLIACGVAAALVWSSGVGALLALGGGTACAFTIISNYDTASNACFTAYLTAMTAAQAALAAARANAIVVYGNDCPMGEE